MKYIHPDIVVGEAVPEVEPRVDGEALEAIRRLSRWGLWFIGVNGVVILGMLITRPVGWVPYAVFFVGVIVWVVPFVRLKKVLKVYKKDQWCIPFRDGFKYRIILTCAVFVLYVPLFASDRVSTIVMIFGFLVVGGGVLLLIMMRKASEPGQVGCVDCEYPLVGLTLPIECPECGRMIYDETWTTDRVRVRSGWFMWGGMGLVVLGCLIVYTSFARPGMFYGTMPQGVLMKLATSDRGAFEELVAKTLSAAEEAELIEGIIARNDGNGDWDYQSSKQGRWLSQFVGTGKISWDQFDRMYGRVVGSIRLESSGTKRVGEPIMVRLASKYVSIPGSGDGVRYFFRGFVVGDDPEPREGSVGEQYLSFLDNDVLDSAFKYVPRITYTASEAGEIVIRVRLVVAVVPKGGKTTIDWDDEQAMFVPALEWYRVIDLEHRIVVEE